MKQSIEEAAREELVHSYANVYNGNGMFEYGQDAMLNMFKKGAEWRESQIPEHISTVQDCELAVRVIKEKAVDILSKVLGNWVHGGDADCIIAEFEEKLNKGQ